MRPVYLVLLFILFAGCKEGIELSMFNPYPMFHANSSKIWVINRVVKDGVNFGARTLKEKDAIIFFESGKKVYMQPIASLGAFPQKVGTFRINQDQNRCEFSFKDGEWSFYMVHQDFGRMYLRPTEDSDFEYELELVSYPL